MNPSQLRQLADELLEINVVDPDMASICFAANHLLDYAKLLEDLGNCDIEEANRSLLEVEE